MNKEIKYFHPSVKQMPNGVHYQRGGFLYECKVNKEAFTNSFFDNAQVYTLDEAIHPTQYGLADYRGGIIVFSVDVNAKKFSDNAFINKLKQFLATIQQRLTKDKKIGSLINKFNKTSEEYIGAFSLGNFFHGKYVSDDGKVFDEKSMAMEINGLSTKSLIKVAEAICNEFSQETVLVKDLNANKIFLVNGEPSEDYDLSQINKNT